MNTKCVNFCLVLATVFAFQPLQASNCSEIRELLVNKSSEQRLTQIGFVVLTSVNNHQHTSAAHALWPQQPQQLYAIVRDYESFPEFIPRVARSTRMASSAGRSWIYQRLKFPAPFKDRHYVMESRSRADGRLPGHFTVDWTLSDRFDMPRSGDPAVTPDQFSGCWDIRPTDNGGIDAVYSVTFEPGGFIPNWIAGAAGKRYLEELMMALQQRLSTHPPSGKHR